MRTRPILSATAAVVLWAMVATACGSSDDGAVTTGGDDATTSSAPTADTGGDTTEPTDGGTETTQPPDLELFDSYEGVTADSIKVGALYADLDELRELGLVDINNGDIPLIWDTLVADFNAEGGVLGRDLEVVQAAYNPVFNASADEACVLLTRDESVFAVLGGVAGPAIDSVLCFVDINDTIMVGGSHTPDHLPQAKAPWVTITMAEGRRIPATIALYDEEGLLEGTLATFDDSSEHDSITGDVVIPALEDLGYEVKTQLTSTIPQGDEVALADQVGTFAERLEQDEVDTLIIVQSQIALGFALMREAGFEGTVLVIDRATTLNDLGSFDERDPSTYDGAYGPSGFSREEQWALESTQECISIFTDANPDVEVLPSYEVPDGDPNWSLGILPVCQLLQTFKLIGEGAGADLNPDTFLASAEQLGPYELAARPFNSLSAGKLDADDALRLAVFDAAEGEAGRLVPVTEVQNVG